MPTVPPPRAVFAQPIVSRAKPELLRSHFIPTMEKLKKRAGKVVAEEEQLRMEAKAETEDAEMLIRDEFSVLCRDLYALYPLLIRYVDNNRFVHGCPGPVGAGLEPWEGPGYGEAGLQLSGALEGMGPWGWSHSSGATGEMWPQGRDQGKGRATALRLWEGGVGPLLPGTTRRWSHRQDGAMGGGATAPRDYRIGAEPVEGAESLL